MKISTIALLTLLFGAGAGAVHADQYDQPKGKPFQVISASAGKITRYNCGGNYEKLRHVPGTNAWTSVSAEDSAGDRPMADNPCFGKTGIGGAGGDGGQ